MNQFDLNVFSYHHCNTKSENIIADTANYLNSIELLSLDNVIEIFVRMLRTHDNQQWFNTIIPILQQKYNGEHNIQQIYLMARNQYTNEQIN